MIRINNDKSKVDDAKLIHSYWTNWNYCLNLIPIDNCNQLYVQISITKTKTEKKFDGG